MRRALQMNQLTGDTFEEYYVLMAKCKIPHCKSIVKPVKTLWIADISRRSVMRSNRAPAFYALSSHTFNRINKKGFFVPTPELNHLRLCHSLVLYETHPAFPSVFAILKTGSGQISQKYILTISLKPLFSLNSSMPTQIEFSKKLDCITLSSALIKSL